MKRGSCDISHFLWYKRHSLFFCMYPVSASRHQVRCRKKRTHFHVPAFPSLILIHHPYSYSHTYPITFSSLGRWFNDTAPSSVTANRFSIRTPPFCGRYMPGSTENTIPFCNGSLQDRLISGNSWESRPIPCPVLCVKYDP